MDDEPKDIITQELRDHYVNYGWNLGDALHCRTRAIWEPEMLFISVKKIKSVINLEGKLIAFATSIDYSGKGLKEQMTNLH